jgi:hypothetical protein
VPGSVISKRICARLSLTHGQMQVRTAFAQVSSAKNASLLEVEPMTGIEPAYSAWEADVLPLNYIGLFDWHC